MNIRTVDFATWLDEQNSGHFDMLMMGWLGNIDPDDFYYAQHHDGKQCAEILEPEVDRLLDAGASRRIKMRAPTIYRKAATIIADEGSYIYLYNPSVIQRGTRRCPDMKHAATRPSGSGPRASAKAGRNDVHPVVAVRRAPAAVFGRRDDRVLVVVFVLVHLVPGDPVRIALGTRYTPQAYDALRSASGLDRPIIEQFFGYIGSALTGDLGVSFRNGDPVTLTLLERLPATVSLSPGGNRHRPAHRATRRHLVRAARGTVSDAIVRVTSQFGVSVPDFWMGILLIALFASTLHWLPTSGYRPLLDDPGGWLRHIILPGLTVGLVAAAIMTRYIRSAVLEVAAMGYVRTARSKGLPPRVVTMRHTVRNAAIPVLTITGIQLATILGGVIVVEVVFAWPARPAGVQRRCRPRLSGDPGGGAAHRGAVPAHQPHRGPAVRGGGPEDSAVMTTTTTTETAEERTRLSAGDCWRATRHRGERVVLAVVVFVAVTAQWIAPFGINDVDVPNALRRPAVSTGSAPTNSAATCSPGSWWPCRRPCGSPW